MQYISRASATILIHEKQNDWQSLTLAPSLPEAPSGPFSPMSPYGNKNIHLQVSHLTWNSTYYVNEYSVINTLFWLTLSPLGPGMPAAPLSPGIPCRPGGPWAPGPPAGPMAPCCGAEINEEGIIQRQHWGWETDKKSYFRVIVYWITVYKHLLQKCEGAIFSVETKQFSTTAKTFVSMCCCQNFVFIYTCVRNTKVKLSQTEKTSTYLTKATHTHLCLDTLCSRLSED